MSKEIGKLIELLNEYRNDGVEEYLENIKSFKIKGGHYSDLYVISKKFGFIQRLIKKDKINTFRLLEKWFDTQKGYEWVHYHTVSEGNLDLLLMLLSIQDNPIEFLISLLK